MQSTIQSSIQEAVLAMEQLREPRCVNFIDAVALAIAEAFRSGNKLLIAGNGGSLCDAMHMAEEFTGFFRAKRPALPALVLSEPGHMSCVSNDAGFEYVFERGVQAFGKPGDIFIGLTTSGKSNNLIRAFEAAKAQGLTTVSFLGKTGGSLKGFADYELLIEGYSTSDRIQEAHMTAIHIIIECCEKYLGYAS
jgi:D-sedoheptulose 7-phosphate isomerase